MPRRGHMRASWARYVKHSVAVSPFRGAAGPRAEAALESSISRGARAFHPWPERVGCAVSMAVLARRGRVSAPPRRAPVRRGPPLALEPAGVSGQ